MLAKSADITQGFQTITADEFLRAVDFTAHWLDSELHGFAPNETISFVGIQDFRYVILEVAAMKTKHPLLLPSPRNAVVNTVSLIRATNCTKLLYTPELTHHVSSLVEAVGSLSTCGIPTLEEMLEGPHQPYKYNATWENNKNDVALIIHTSGSTGAPKARICTHAFLGAFICLSMLAPEVPGREKSDLSRVKKGELLCTGSSFFHMSGIVLGFNTLTQSITVVYGPPHQPSDGKIMHDILKSLPIAGSINAPSVTESMFLEHGADLQSEMSRLKHICWLGGPLSPRLGEYLIKNTNAIIWQIFGSTEVGPIPLLVPPPEFWQYFEFHPKLTPILEETEPGSNLYEIVYRKHLNTALSWSQPVFHLMPELNEWRTRDLVRRYDGPLPDGVGPLYMFERRLDDQIILSNAHKVNPVHMELLLQSHPLLSGCLVFGEGRTRCGILLEGKGGLEMSDEELLEVIWEDVENANATVPEHARVPRNLALVVSGERRLVRAAKGTVVRSLSIKAYQREINDAYERSLNSGF
ncbi:NRPS-like enzyme protein [Rutstroemia sp. NJR-2017a BBW]|nr:NRPS-like enzyme protein [Rutstroemia sp. NJR-2017a BBW]